MALLGLLAEVHAGLDLWLHQAHLGHDPLHSHELVHQVCLQTPRSDVVLPELPLKIHMVHLHLLWEVWLHQCLLLLLLAELVLIELFGAQVQKVLEHLDGLQRVVHHILG